MGLTIIEVKKNDKSSVNKELFDKQNRLSSDFRWIYANSEKLRFKYPNKYIAVKNRRVAFAFEDAKHLLDKVALSGGSVDDFAVEYVHKKPSFLLF